MNAQITPVGNCGAVITSYTNTVNNDSIYLFFEDANPALVANAPIGVGPFDFYWQTFLSSTNSWTALSDEQDVTSSTITNLTPSAYRVSIFDANGVFVIAYQAWVSDISFQAGTCPEYIIQMESDCNSVHLWVDFVPGTGGVSMTPFYDLPPAPFPVDANTEISICFSGNHSWVSDLGFYLIGPASCGSPVISLSPNPGSIGMGLACNSGNNISNLCFSTESSTNLNVCTAPAPLSGTYGTYGATPTPIIWTNLYGCDANAGGWAVQVFDCVGLDTGNLTDATLNFSGPNSIGVQSNMSYTTPVGFSSPISDNSCSQASASIFQVSNTVAVPLNYTWHWEWNADPYAYIPDSLDNWDVEFSAPLVETVFSLDFVLLDANNEYVTLELEEFQDLNDCGMNCAFDNSITFTPSDYITPMVFGPSPVCENEFVQLIASEPGGIWSGPGIDPMGNIPMATTSAMYIYTINEECYLPAFFDLVVMPNIIESYNFDLGAFCNNAGVIPIPSSGPNPFFSGMGVNQIGGNAFMDPSSIPGGYYTISETGGDPFICMTYSAVHNVEILVAPIANLNPIADLCDSSSPVLLTSNLPNGIWSGPGVSVDVFDPSIGEGQYIIDFIDFTNCNAQGQLIVNVFPEPTVLFDDPGLICSNGSPISLTTSTSGGQWTGAGITNALTGTFDPTISGDGAISVNYSTFGICPTSNDWDVIVTAEPQPNAGADVTICEGQTTVLSIAGNWDSIEWSNGELTNSITVDQPNVYSVLVSADGCFGSDDVVLNVTTMPIIDLGNDIQNVCEGSTITIYANYNGNWSNGTTGSTTSIGEEGLLIYVYPNSGCPVSDSVYIDVIQYPNLNLGSDLEICPQDFVVISTNGLIGTWNLGYSGTEISVNIPNAYVFTTSNWECSSNDTVFVSWKDLPILNLQEEIIGCIDEQVVMDVENDANTYYLWSTGEAAPSISVTETDTYSVTVGNECGEVEATTNVVFEDCSPTIFIPNAFSPNQDGINDVWMPKMYGIESFDLKVLNRWGFVVFETNDPTKVWTGDVQDSAYYSPDGIYSFIIEYVDIRNNSEAVVGTVLMMR